MSPDERAVVPGPVPDADSVPTLEQTPVGASQQPPRSRRRRWVLLAALVVVGGAVFSATSGEADIRDGTTAVTRAEMSAQHGVDFNLVAVTAAGGLIQLRMQVTDPDKANEVMHGDAETRPIIVAEDSGATLQMSAPPHHRDELDLGSQYFFLLANAGNALHPGSEVTLIVGDSRIEHVRVEG